MLSSRTRSQSTLNASGDRPRPSDVPTGQLGSVIARRSVLGLLLRLLSVGMGIVSTVVIVRALGSHEFGLFTLGLAIAGIITQLADFGITQAVTKLSTQDPENATHIASVAMTVRLVLTAVLGSFGVVLALSLAGREAALVVAVLIATAPLSTASVLVGLANARLRPELGPLLVAGQSFLWCIVCVVLTRQAPTPLSFAIGLAVTVCMQSLATIVLITGFHIPHRFNLSSAKQILRVSWAPAVLGIFVTAYYRLDSGRSRPGRLREVALDDALRSRICACRCRAGLARTGIRRHLPWLCWYGVMHGAWCREETDSSGCDPRDT